MSIVAYVGRPRSGKSYGVVENVVIPSLKIGRTVLTNIPLKTGYLSDDFPDGKIIQFSPQDPFDDENFWDLDNHPGAIWIIDECWRYWKSGTTAKNIPELQQRFFAEHGHCVGDDGKTTEIVLVTQSLDQLAAFVRGLVEETFRATKLSALGSKNKYRVDVFSGAQKGLDGGKPNRQLMGTYKPEIYKYYTSHTNNKTDFAAGMEEKADDRNNIWKSPFFRFGIPAVLVLFLFCVYMVIGYFTRFSSDESEPQQLDPVQKVPSTFMAQPVPNSLNSVHQKASIDPAQQRIINATKAMKKMDVSRHYLPLSDQYRIVGVINDQFLIWGENGTRYVPTYRCSKFSPTKEDYCVIDGHLVTWYSSERPVIESDHREYFEAGKVVEDVF